MRVDLSAVEARAKELGARRTFKVEAQYAAYINLMGCIDLTTLTGGDTAGRVQRLCKKALRPLDPAIAARYPDVTVGAVCVHPAMVAYAVKAVGRKIPVASVATNFPSGQSFETPKLAEIEMAADMGATEIDVVISRGRALEGGWRFVASELELFRAKCGDRAKMKVILGVGDLETLENVAKASEVALAVCRDGDFIKTSTGFEKTNATLEAGIVMARAVRESGKRVGIKPAGGIKTAKDAMLWYSLMLEELGGEWCRPDLFRIGASGGHADVLIGDLNRQLHHLESGGCYSAFHRHGMS